MAQPEPVEFYDDPGLEWTYVNDLGAISWDGTTVRIELDLVTPPRGQQAGGDGRRRRRPVVRMALSPSAAEQLYRKLGELRTAIAARRKPVKSTVLN